MSMTDITPAPNCAIPQIYVASFNRKTASLSNTLRARLRCSRAILVQSHPIISIYDGSIPASVETIFEQIQPSIWKFCSQIVKIEGPASVAEQQTIHTWALARREHFVSPGGPQFEPVFDALASVLESGREGRDFVLLSRVPAVMQRNS
jgi:hypothetical protein